MKIALIIGILAYSVLVLVHGQGPPRGFFPAPMPEMGGPGNILIYNDQIHTSPAGQGINLRDGHNSVLVGNVLKYRPQNGSNDQDEPSEEGKNVDDVRDDVQDDYQVAPGTPIRHVRANTNLIISGNNVGGAPSGDSSNVIITGNNVGSGLQGFAGLQGLTGLRRQAVVNGRQDEIYAPVQNPSIVSNRLLRYDPSSFTSCVIVEICYTNGVCTRSTFNCGPSHGRYRHGNEPEVVSSRVVQSVPGPFGACLIVQICFDDGSCMHSTFNCVGPYNSRSNSPKKLPQNSPQKSPQNSPKNAPVDSPVNSPVSSPIDPPANSPVNQPTYSPFTSPVEMPGTPPNILAEKSQLHNPVPSFFCVLGGILKHGFCAMQCQVGGQGSGYCSETDVCMCVQIPS